ncbi:MAG: tRNA (guanosine(46)-N7)-methyltransferase TrmB [Alphaproteobacteria bacterium]|nr:tRNA (guanosine(46)-N7)-methyltransferase TrmB [Alphaproteobacteria bacterium]
MSLEIACSGVTSVERFFVSSPADHDRLMFYGRRHGRRLRPRQAEYLARGMAAFGLPEDTSLTADGLDPRGFFDHAPDQMFLEIGFGGGEHLAARAEENPNAGYLGAEPFMNGVASLCRHLIERKITNTRIWPEDVRLLLPGFQKASFDGVFVLFPDPWPKTRHQDRRIIQPLMLDELARLIRPGGELLLASDEPKAKTWMMEQMMRRDDFTWTAGRARDWRTPPAGWPGTRYMAKADREGRVSNWFLFKRI